MIENIRETSIPGCFGLKVKVHKDLRGSFTKTFHVEFFKEYGLESCFSEQYYSISRKFVLRGLHCQIPPEEHTKLVCCIRGAVIDAVVDLRIGSPTYGRYEIFNLQGDGGYMIYMPPGVAHGFYTLRPGTIMLYNTTRVYHPLYDSGIRWNSAGIPWPTDNPIVSERDSKLEQLKYFSSPFKYSI